MKFQSWIALHFDFLSEFLRLQELTEQKEHSKYKNFTGISESSRAVPAMIKGLSLSLNLQL